MIPKFHTEEKKKRLLKFIGDKNKKIHKQNPFSSENGCLNPDWEN